MCVWMYQDGCVCRHFYNNLSIIRICYVFLHNNLAFVTWWIFIIYSVFIHQYKENQILILWWRQSCLSFGTDGKNWCLDLRVPSKQIFCSLVFIYFLYLDLWKKNNIFLFHTLPRIHEIPFVLTFLIKLPLINGSTTCKWCSHYQLLKWL